MRKLYAKEAYSGGTLYIVSHNNPAWFKGTGAHKNAGNRPLGSSAVEVMLAAIQGEAIVTHLGTSWCRDAHRAVTLARAVEGPAAISRSDCWKLW